MRGRLGDFSVHDSTNARYRTVEYDLKKLLKIEKKIEKKLERAAIRRYEKSYPGEHIVGQGLVEPPKGGLRRG